MFKFIIGLYQLITGLFGAIFVALSYFAKSSVYANNQTVVSQVITGFILYGLLAWMGYGLIKEQSKAKTFSIFLQAIQIPLLYTPNYIYKFTSAGFLSLGIKNSSFVFHSTLQPVQYTLSVNQGGPTSYMIYILPLLFVILLAKSK